MKFKEIEFKYDAQDVSMNEFVELMETFKIDKKLLVSSYDDYFIDSADNFIRYRHHDARGELTIKRKTNVNNNNERIEVNLPTEGNNLNAVAAFVNLLGYQHNFGIYKTCNIFWIDKVVMVYYVVYDKELKEKRRFIEIEANEELPWESEDLAWAEIERYEALLAPLGVTPKNRLKKSLYETFKKS